MFCKCLQKIEHEDIEVVVPKARHEFGHRLDKEFERLQKSLPTDVIGIERLMCEEDEAWRALVSGPANTPYAGGTFAIDISFPANYPYEQPAMCFSTPIYHVNVDPVTGEICCSDFQWAPASTVAHLLQVITAMLHVPDNSPQLTPEEYKTNDLPVEKDIIRRFHQDRAAYDLMAQQWTKDHAM
mmetsp:Transcript_51662/g.122975  ORF Transcript_51662/g.122975 Transcript_51662/m.122975 type:complete len:184 (-) Transcript_51662:387-938(-)